MTGAAKRIVLEVLGWTLLVLGVAAIFLPGPGLLGIFAGLALLSQQYDWAERRVEPVRLRAMLGAAESVETWPRIVASCLGAIVLAACGVLWIIKPPAPDWWPLADTWWLPGGVWTNDWGGWKMLTENGWATTYNSSATTCSSPTPSGSSGASRRASPTASSSR